MRETHIAENERIERFAGGAAQHNSARDLRPRQWHSSPTGYLHHCCRNNPFARNLRSCMSRLLLCYVENGANVFGLMSVTVAGPKMDGLDYVGFLLSTFSPQESAYCPSVFRSL